MSVSIYRKFLKLSLAIALTTGCLHAAPYGPDGMPIEWTQPDGSKISLRVFGDEFYARTETLDGYTVVFDPATKSYQYAKPSNDSKKLVSAGIQVGKGNPKALELAKHLDIDPKERKAKIKARYDQWNNATGNSKRWSERKAKMQAADKAAFAPQLDGGESSGGTSSPSPAFAPPPVSGNKVGLTLLIDFSDSPATISQATIVNLCNADNFTGYSNASSVKKYFQDVSSGQLVYTNVVTAYIRMAQPKSYYNVIPGDPDDQNSSEQGSLLIRDAIAIMKALPNYNTEILPTFSTLTVDGSNNILATNVFFAGANSNKWAQGLWPHQSGIPATELSPGGMKVQQYQISDIGTSPKIGTFCHENGHMLLGYPDIYDYDGDSRGGAGSFCLMGLIPSNTNPPLINAYLRHASGWTTTTELTSSSNLTGTLTATVGHTDFNKIYRYAKPGTPTEYFIFENRQKTGRDAALAASGLAIWHIDELGDNNNQSLASNSSHANYEVSLIQADNLWHFQSDTNSGDSRDLYYLGNTAAGYTNTFNGNTAPDAKWWSGASSGLNVHNISSSAATMTMQFGLPPNTIAVKTPNGGEQFYLSSNQNITWDSNTSGNVKIELFKAGVLNTVLSASETNDGSYSWAVSSGLTPGNDYSIKISSVANPAYTDSSNVTFSILANTVTVLAPNGGEQIYFNATQNITWNSNAPGHVKIELFKGGVLNTVLSASETNDGSYSWVVSSGLTTGNDYSIKISSVANPAYMDSSNATFSILVNPLNNALDTTELVWSSSGNLPWFSQTTTTHDGVDAARSGAIGFTQVSAMETTVTGPGTLTFWWKVSSEAGYDWLRFHIDGVEQPGSIAGEVGWVEKTAVIPAGIHILKWSYTTDYAIVNGSDAAWVDEVVFTPTSSTYNVTYNGNGHTGGSVPVDSNSYSNAANVTVLGNTGNLMRTGYVFAGWNTAADGSGTNYSAGNTFSISSDATLYAKWTPNTYTLSFNKQSGTGGSSSATATFGLPMPVATMPTLTGYTFGGYYTQASGAGIQYYTPTMASARNWDIASATTLYAKWNLPPAVNAGNDQTVNLSEAPAWTPGISYHSITGDADSGISSSKAYTHALDFGSDATRAIINGVQFQAGGTTFGSISGTSATIGTGSTNIPTAHAGDTTAAPFLNGPSACAMEGLVKDMNYNAANGVITLTGLTPGAHYQFKLYNRCWGSVYDRSQNIGFETNGIGTTIAGSEYTATFNQDDARTPGPSFATYSQVYALTLDYVLAPGVTSLKVYINRTSATAGTYHLYGLTNEKVPESIAVANLTGTVSDPDAQAVTTNWTVVSAPSGGTATFGSASALNTSVIFNTSGTYTLRLTATDGVDTVSDDVVITVASPVQHFVISAIPSPQIVGTPMTGITITAQDASDATATSFTGTVTYGGTAGVTGTSANFISGVLTGVSITPSTIGNNLTFTVNNGTSTGSANITVLPSFISYITNPTFGLAVEDQEFNDDPDADGLKNGVEAMFGTHPGQFSTGLQLPVTNGTTTTFTHPRNPSAPANLSLVYEWSPNLTNWYAGDGVAGPAGGARVIITSVTINDTTTVTAVSDVPQQQIFLRAAVNQN